MSNYKSSNDPAKGSPNLEAEQYSQSNWDKDKIAAAVLVEKISVTASGTSGVLATSIPVGAEIMDVYNQATATSGGGTVQLTVGGGGAAITDAMAMATLDAITRASTIDQTYKIVGADSIEVVTNADADLGDVYVIYKK